MPYPLRNLFCAGQTGLRIFVPPPTEIWEEVSYYSKLLETQRLPSQNIFHFLCRVFPKWFHTIYMDITGAKDARN